MKKTFFSIIALLFSGAVAAQTADEVNLKFNEAVPLITAKKYMEAIPVLEKTVEMATASTDDVAETLTEAQKQLATCYTTAGAMLAKQAKYDEALAFLKKASDIAELTQNSSMKSRADKMVGTIYSIEGDEKIKAEDFKGAAEFYVKAVSVDDKNTSAMIKAAQAYAKVGEMDKAGEYYSSVISLGATHSKYADDATTAKTAYTTDLMNAAATAENFETAQTALEKILSFDATNANAYSNLIKSANNFKKYDIVISNATKAVEAQTDAAEKSDLYFLIGAAYEIKQDKANAISAYKNVVSGDKAADAKKQIEALSK